MTSKIMTLSVADRMETIEEYYFSRKLQEIDKMNATGEKVINLGIGNPDGNPPLEAVKKMGEALFEVGMHGYQSYKGVAELRNAFGKWYKKYFSVSLNPETEILPLLGSKEGIMHISMAFLNSGDEVLIPNPGYPTYRAVSELAGATCIPYSLEEHRNWMPDLDALEQMDLSKVKLMWINYPNMPTGAAATYRLFEQLVDFAIRHEILLCHDNPYSFIQPSDGSHRKEQLSILKIPRAKEVALELNSLSKSHNMAGWRIGVLLANEYIVQQVLRFKSNMDSGRFLPMQLAAIEALSVGEEWYESLNKEYYKRKVEVVKLLELLGCSYKSEQQGMFVWAKVPTSYKDGYALSDKVLRDHRVFITPGGIFGDKGLHYIRISLCGSISEIQEVYRRLQQVESLVD